MQRDKGQKEEEEKKISLFVFEIEQEFVAAPVSLLLPCFGFCF